MTILASYESMQVVARGNLTLRFSAEMTNFEPKGFWIGLRATIIRSLFYISVFLIVLSATSIIGSLILKKFISRPKSIIYERVIIVLML